MPTPFPGMDPYLEQPALWPNVHTSLIIAIRDELAPRLRPRYYIAVEERIVRMDSDELVFAIRPDVSVFEPSTPQAGQELLTETDQADVVSVELSIPDEVREVYLEIRSVETRRVVTVIEILSPANKRLGEGREEYLRKRLNILRTFTHLVEIDLLRMGEPMSLRGYDRYADYRILVSQAQRRPKADLRPFSVRQAIPTFPLPLLPEDDEPVVDLNQLLHVLYDRAGYDLRINYQEAPDPPLSDADAAWADALLHKAGLR